MQIATNAIVPITDATKHFRDVCEKTRALGTTFLFKNNRPDLVMMDIAHYEQLMELNEALEHMEIADLIAQRAARDSGRRYTLDDVL